MCGKRLPRNLQQVRLQYFARLWNDDSRISSVKYAVLLAFFSADFIVAAELLSDAVLADGQEAGKTMSEKMMKKVQKPYRIFSEEITV